MRREFSEGGFNLMKNQSSPDNRNRELVFNYIRDNPGATFGRIKNVLNLNKGTLRYHLNFLIKEDNIRSCLKNGKNCYFASLFIGENNGYETYQSSLKQYQKRILKLIETRPNITRGELLNLTSENKRKISYTIDQFLRKKIIIEKRNGDEICYRIINRDLIIDEMLLLLVKDLSEEHIDKETFLRLKKEILKYKE